MKWFISLSTLKKILDFFVVREREWKWKRKRENKFQIFYSKWMAIRVILSFHMVKWLKKNGLQFTAKKEFDFSTKTKRKFNPKVIVLHVQCLIVIFNTPDFIRSKIELPHW